MKKFLFTFLFGLTVLAACSQNGLRGNVYTLSTSPKDMPFTISFSDTDNRFSGKALNNYFGTYEINGDTLALRQTGATMMAGAPDDMQAEQDYFQNLTNVVAYRISGDQLVLILNNHRELLFERTDSKQSF